MTRINIHGLDQQSHQAPSNLKPISLLQETSHFSLLSHKLDHPVIKIIILGIQYIVYYIQKKPQSFLWTNVLSLKFDETF